MGYNILKMLGEALDTGAAGEGVGAGGGLLVAPGPGAGGAPDEF